MKKLPSLELKSLFKNSFGVSIIEIILVVFTVGFITLFVANIPSSLKLVGNSRHESLAKEIALKNVEDLRTSGYDNLANGTSTISDSRISSLPGGSGQIIIDDCPAQAICQNGEQVKRAKVEVNWTDSGNSKNIQITTLISKGGLR